MYKFKYNLKKEKRIFLLFFSFIVFSFLFSSTFVYAESLDFDGDNYSDEIEDSYGTSANNPESYPLDTDGDGTQDNDSADGKFLGDLDDDNDGLLDIYEGYVGSNSKDCSDVLSINISYTNYFLVDIQIDGFYDKICKPQKGYYSNLGKENDIYLIDINNDGVRDFTYQNGLISEYKNSDSIFDNIWLYVIIIIIAIILIIIIFFKTGILCFYEEEYIVEE